MKSLSNLATERVKKLVPYQSARRIGGKGRIFLNANESPYSSAFDIDTSLYNRYPDCQPPELMKRFAAYAGVNTENCLVSRGSDEAIELLIRTFCEEGRDKVLICPPTYGMYKVSADANGIETLEVPPLPDFTPDAEAIVKAVEAEPVKIVFICTPNNPTGNTVPEDVLERILQGTDGKAIVVADEAYIDFCPERTVIALQKKYRNLVVTRTLSKAFGLAGIRCGFTIADSEIIQLLLKIIEPYPVSFPVAQIAEQALSGDGISMVRERVGTINKTKQEVIGKLKGLKCVSGIFEACGNFVLVRFKNGNEVFNKMAEKGIILRNWGDKPRISDCVRLTIGTDDEMREVIEELGKL
ncbi:MAG: histidinol-phosphate transaminase [Succinivibrionaceae bacterium]|nr:histidinol-phosphate transaminase [Succinivibrionaceae bacterium]